MKDNRNQLTDAIIQWIGSRQHGYYITLGTQHFLKSQTDTRLQDCIDDAHPKVSKLMGFLKEYCYGNTFRSTRDDNLLKCVISYEVGDSANQLHAHIVAAHDGTTDRSCRAINDFITRKWSKLIGLTYRQDEFVHVAPIDVARDRVWYGTKQTAFISRWHHVSNISLA